MNDEYYMMWLGRALNYETSKIKKLIEYFGSAEEIYKAGREKLEEAVGRKFGDKIFYAAKNLEIYVNDLEKSGVRYISFFNKNYPKGLKNIDDSPTGIYYKGSLPDENDRLVSVIGSRRCTQYGKQAALKLSKDLASNGVVIVSGLAAGVDSVSAVGALRGGGRTVAVLGTAIDKCYPAENQKLYDSIIDGGGCVMSEYAPGQKTYASDFSKRNRIIAGLSEALVVVEAELRSGTSITVEYAAKYGRTVFAVPGSIFSKYSEGTNSLIRDGCPPVLGADDVLLELGMNMADGKAVKNKTDEPDRWKDLNSDEISVVRALNSGNTVFDELISATGLNETKLRSVLTILEIKKIIARYPGQRYMIL